MNSAKRLKFKTIVISDAHLGKDAAAAEFLLEFLQNVECERLIGAGDMLEGWGLGKKRRKPLLEMHARCMDALNAHAASGTDVIMLRGNHDEDLAKSRYHLMKRTIEFRDRGQKLAARVTFGKSFVHTDLRGRRHLVLHGDVFDSFQKNKGKKKIAKIADVAYENLVNLNRVFQRAVRETTGKNISPASHLKNASKKVGGIIKDFENSVACESVTSKYDGVICGHIHHAEIKQIGNASYMNSGDWVEGCKCLVETHEGEWKIIDWNVEREKLGLKKFPLVTDINQFAEFRGITERQITMMRRIWPGGDYQDLISERKRLRGKIAEHTNALQENFGKVSNFDSSYHRKKIAKHEESIGRLKAQLQPYPRGA